MQEVHLIVDRDTCSVTEINSTGIVASITRSDGDYPAALKDVAASVGVMLDKLVDAPAFRLTVAVLNQADLDAYGEFLNADAKAENSVSEVHGDEQQGSGTPPASIFD